MGNAIRENNLKVYFAMTILMLILGLLGSLLSRLFGVRFSGTAMLLTIGAVINLIAYFFSDRLILRASGAKSISRADAPELYVMTETLAQQEKLPMPKLYLLDTDAMNAFATGRDPAHAAVAVTRGLLEKSTADEVRAVVGHELSHVQNYDTRLMTIVAILAGLVSIVAEIYWRSSVMQKAGEKDRSGVLVFIGLLFAVVAPIAAMFIQLAISRRREFLADTTSSRMTHAPRSLAAALRKISMDQRPLPHVSAATAHLYIANPFRSDGFVEKLFATHPPVEERIAALEAMS